VGKLREQIKVKKTSTKEQIKISKKSSDVKAANGHITTRKKRRRRRETSETS